MGHRGYLPVRAVLVGTALAAVQPSVPCGAETAGSRPATPAAEQLAADPQDGSIVDGVYSNPYFGLRYPLPSGWQKGLEGPAPSPNGYYVLSTPDAPDPEHPGGTVVISAQDMFFDLNPMTDARATLNDLRKSATDGNGQEPGAATDVTLAGRSFARVEIDSSILPRIVLATDIRCHVVMFTFASPDRELLAKLAASVDGATLPKEASATGIGSPGPDSSSPVCIKDYATSEHVLHRVEPNWVSFRFPKIAVRVVIGRDGRAKHVHVISAEPQQAKNIEDALAQWEFKPYEVNGHPVEVETGLIFQFKREPG